ncbi:hypothetical protein H1R20_g12021, partial [Candolleomyces eurysporus]
MSLRHIKLARLAKEKQERSMEEVLKDLLTQELGNHTPMTDDSWISSLYLDTATPAAIDKFLKDSGEYENGRWTRIPETLRTLSKLNESLCKVVNSILDRFLPSRSDTSRVAVYAHAHQFKAEVIEGSQYYCSPDVVVKASGPSFSLPKGSSLGFSNIATCFNTRWDNEAEEYSRHLAYFTACAKHMFTQQPNRLFLRFLVITESRANLFHIDRSGAQYTPLFKIHDDPHMFVRLILGLSSVDERTLGLDDSIKWIVDADGQTRHGTVKTMGADNTIVTYELVAGEDPFVRTTLCGRGTVCWTARNAEGEKVIVKDYWSSGGRTPEFELLDEARDVRGVCQMVSYEANRFHTKDLRGSMKDSETAMFQNRTAARIVMKVYGLSIECFSSVQEVLAALRDAIAAHKSLLGRNIIHRDISPNNILLGTAGAQPGERGILIDLGIALRSNGPGAQNRADPRIGTRMFQALIILNTVKLEEDEISAYDFLDDLEAFFWVFAYLICVYRADGQPAPKSPFQAYPSSWQDSDPVEAHSAKYCFISLPGVAGKARRSMDEGWRFACADLFVDFRKYVCKLAEEKEELAFGEGDREFATEHSLPNRFAPLLEDVDKHYAYILGLFDRALRMVEAGQAESTSAGQADISPPSCPPSASGPLAVSVNKSPVTLSREVISSSSIGYLSTAATSSTTPTDPPSLPASLNQSRGSKRQSGEAELENSPTDVKRRCV